MPKFTRDLTFLIVFTILLAVIAFGVTNNVRVMKHEINHHRYRNEAENICQLEALQVPLKDRADLKAWLQLYADCVDRRSGTESPIDLSKEE